MAFGDTIMKRFSDEAVELDPAYEGLYDTDTDMLNEFMSIACENCDPYDPDCDDDDDYIEFDDDEDDEDDDEYDEYDDDADEGCCKEGCRKANENAITDATPEQKRANFFKMVDANPKFDAERKKQLKANYDAKHGFGQAVKESAADYARALRMLDRGDEELTNDVDDAYDTSDYDDDYLTNHAKYASNLRTGYQRLVERGFNEINNFCGDKQAGFSANLHTKYARESVYDYDEDTLSNYDNYYEDEDELRAQADLAYESIMAARRAESEEKRKPNGAYEEMAFEHLMELGNSDEEVEDAMENCKDALDEMLADLENL